MRGGLGILACNNFAGRANPSRIFAGQARVGQCGAGWLARFAIPTYWSVLELQQSSKTILLNLEKHIFTNNW